MKIYGKIIRYVDYKGKDISFDRWRFDLYYMPHLAETHFENSEADALAFLEKIKGKVYEDYDAFRGDFSNVLPWEYKNEVMTVL